MFIAMSTVISNFYFFVEQSFNENFQFLKEELNIKTHFTNKILATAAYL